MPTVRISDPQYDKVKALSDSTNMSMTKVLDDLIDRALNGQPLQAQALQPDLRPSPGYITKTLTQT